MADHFNRLTPAELERLAYLGEELCEVGQIIGKIIRHGYESRDPTKATPIFDDNRGGQIGYRNLSPTNRELLENELGDVLRAIVRMAECGDVREWKLKELQDRPYPTKYMHHQKQREAQSDAR